MQDIFNKIKKFNSWDNKSFNTGFQREFYLKKILKFQGNSLVKVIVGQRRVGKSYLLRQIMNFLREVKNVNPKNIFYLNKEYLAFDAIKTASDLEELFEFYKNELDIDGKIYIFLDEVQNIKEWEKFVNSYSQDFSNEYELFITGSNSTLLSGELATLLSGRYVEFAVFPFDFLEFCQYKNIEMNKANFLTYLKEGSLPEMFNFKDEEIKRHYISSLRNTIIFRDILSRHKVKDMVLMEELFNFICTNIGSLTSLNSLVRYFKSKQKKTSYDTLASYVDYLKDTFIVHEAQRYNLRGKQILGAERKYYLNDVAFKNLLFGFYPEDIGYQLENFVFLELKRRQYNVMVGVLGDKEVDFVGIKANKTVYIQVAYLLKETKTIEREFGNLLKIKDNFEKIVVSLDDTQFSDYQGIKHIKPWELNRILD